MATVKGTDGKSYTLGTASYTSYLLGTKPGVAATTGTVKDGGKTYSMDAYAAKTTPKGSTASGPTWYGPGAGQNTTTSNPPTITPESMQSTGTPKLPAYNVPGGSEGIMASIQAQIAAAQQKLTEATSAGYSGDEVIQYGSDGKPAKKGNKAMELFQGMLSSLQGPTNTADMYEKERAAAGIEQKQQAVNNLSGQLNMITAESQANQLSLVGQGRGIPSAIIGGQQAQIAREAAIKALPVAAQLAAAQGNLELAQSHLNTVFKLKSEDAQNMANFKNKLVEAVYGFASKEQQNALDEKRINDKNKFDLMQSDIQYSRQLANAALESGQSELAGQIAGLDFKDPDFSTQLAALAGKITQNPLDVQLKEAQIANIKNEMYNRNRSNDRQTEEQKKGNQADDIAQAVLDFQQKINANGWSGANPQAYSYYKSQLVSLYGASAALALDKQMADLGIAVDYENK